LPDGLFSYQKSKFGYILEGLGMEKVGKFYDPLEYFTAIWYILWLLGIVCWYIIPVLVCLDQEKSANPAANAPFLI
jgi:cyanate permease